MDQQSTEPPQQEPLESRKLNPWMISTFVLAILLLFAARVIFFVPQENPIPNPPTQIPTSQKTFTGMLDCLPHRDTSGGQTLECTLGLRVENGDFYKLWVRKERDIDSIISNKIQAGTKVQVSGSLLWLKMPDPIYDTKGTIEVISVESK